MRKTELIVSGEVIHPKTKASIVAHEHTNVEALLDQQNRTSSTITQSASTSKVGVGDGEDLSFCVEDGFYESATLYGKTLVNSIQEPSGQDVVLPYEFEEGQYVTINDTKESGALSVELKGQTLVNLIEVSTKTPLFVQLHSNAQCFLGKCDKIKPSTTYTVFYTVTEQTSTANKPCFNLSSGSGKPDITIEPTKDRVVFTTPSNYSGAGKTMRLYYFSNDTCKISHMVLLEGDYTDVDIPYFEGMTSCKMPTLITCDEYSYKIGTYMTNGSLSTNQQFLFFDCKPNTKYEITVKSGKYNRFGVFSYQGTLGKALKRIDVFKDYVAVSDNSVQTATGTTSATANLIGVYLSQGNYNQTLQGIDIEVLENGRRLANKSSILSLPEEVVLRSLPNGVCDTFNTRTGVYMQRIGEIVLDGSEEWIKVARAKENTSVFFSSVTREYAKKFDNKYVGGHVNCDKFSWSSVDLGREGTNDIEGSYTAFDGNICIAIAKSRLTSNDAGGFKQYLQSNPTTVQYELETPVITKINLPSTLKSWNTTTHIYSEIPENTLYPILSHSNPTYPVILKPSTKYSIVANSHSNGHTNSAINFNLGGATASTVVNNRVATVTTPSTLTSEEIVMSGRGNKLSHVMVIEGEVVGDEPYFEGICDCQSPILTNCGKNLFDLHSYFSTVSHIAGVSLTDNGLKLDAAVNSVVMNAISQFYLVTNLRSDRQYRITYNLVNEGELKAKPIIHYMDGGSKSGGLNSTNTLTTELNRPIKGIGLTWNTQSGGGKTTISNIMIQEVGSDEEYEPYKSNILSCTNGIVKLTEDMFEQGTITANANQSFEQCKATSLQRIRSRELLQLKQGTYSISASSNYNLLVAGFRNGLYQNTSGWQSSNYILRVTDESISFGFIIKKNDDSNITTTNFNESRFAIQEVDKTVVLRSLPNGTCDTLNVETGEYVQRIGEIVVDGSENWTIHNNSNSNRIVFKTSSKLSGYNTTTSIADKIRTSKIASGISDLFGYSFLRIGENTATPTAGVFLHLEGELTSMSNVTKLTEWLQANPITVQYELKTPVVRTIDVQGFPYAYANGHVQLSSGSIEQSLTPKVEYVVQTNRAGAIQANQDRLLNHDKRLAMLEDLVLHQLIQLEYNRAKCTFLSQTRQIFEGGIQMYHTKYELLSEFIEKKLYRSLEEVFEMLDVYFMLGDITDGEYDVLYEALMPSAEEIFEVEETFDHEDVEV